MYQEPMNSKEPYKIASGRHRVKKDYYQKTWADVLKLSSCSCGFL